MTETKTTNKTQQKVDTGDIAVGGLILGAIYLFTKKSNPTPGGEKASFNPTSGPDGTVVSVVGSGWTAGETITSITLGGPTAENTLLVDAQGNLSGTIIVPDSLNAGKQTIIITGTKSGSITFANAFTVAGAGSNWVLMTTTPTIVAVVLAQGTAQWVLMTPTATTMAISLAQGGSGWVLMTAMATTLKVTVAQGTGIWVLMTTTATTLTISLAAIIPQLIVSPTTLKTGDILSFTFYNFTPMASVSVYVVGGGGLNITANALGSGTASFTIGESSGTYTLEATDGYGRSATTGFTVQAAAMVTLNIDDDGSGYGFVEITVGGVDVGGNGYQVPKGTSVTVRAYVDNPNVARFNGWTDPGGALNSMSAGPLTFTANSNVNLVANFQYTGSSGGGGGGSSTPSFPAPGRVGDGYYWYWVKFADGSIGWDDSDDVIYYTHPTILSGPYASGATQ